MTWFGALVTGLGAFRRGPTLVWTSLAMALPACEASNAVVKDAPDSEIMVPQAPHSGASMRMIAAAAGSGAVAIGPRVSGQSAQITASGSSPSATAPSPGVACAPTGYTRAVHITVDVSWPDSLGITGGNGQMQIWNAMTFGPPGSETSVETRACGADIPAQTTTAVAGGYKVQGQVPYSAYDSASMPKTHGTATKQGQQLTVNPTTAVLGVQLTDPMGPWPTSSEAAKVTSVDSDGDGKPGITAIPRQDTGFSLVPINVFQTDFADELYSAQRSSIRLSGIEDGCPESIDGEAEVELFDTLVIGCHIKAGGNCSADEVKFLNDSRPIMKRVKASWTARLAPDSVSCADVRALVP